MKASIVDLRYKMKDVLKALDQNEEVKILYHGKIKGTIIPNIINTSSKIKEHPFFGMHRDRKKTVLDELEDLRGIRNVV